MIAFPPGFRIRHSCSMNGVRSGPARCSRKWEQYTSSTEASFHGHGGFLRSQTISTPSTFAISTPIWSGCLCSPHPRSSLTGLLSAGGSYTLIFFFFTLSSNSPTHLIVFVPVAHQNARAGRKPIAELTGTLEELEVLGVH